MAFHRAKARGGVGLIIFEHTGIDRPGNVIPLMEPLIDADRNTHAVPIARLDRHGQPRNAASRGGPVRRQCSDGTAILLRLLA